MTKSIKRLSPEARRTQLMEAAIACYSELGVERAGHGDVAKRAGVSTATVFNYFSTKESLTEAVFASVQDAFKGMFTTMPPLGETPQQHIQNMASTYDYLAEQHPDLLKVVLNWSASFGESVRPQYLEFQERVLMGIQFRLEQANVDRAEARIVLAAAFTYASMKLDGTPDDVLQKFVDRIIKAIS